MNKEEKGVDLHEETVIKLTKKKVEIAPIVVENIQLNKLNLPCTSLCNDQLTFSILFKDFS